MCGKLSRPRPRSWLHRYQRWRQGSDSRVSWPPVRLQIFAEQQSSIVLVHGLGGNPRRTWSASIHPVPASAEPRLSKGTKLRALAGRQFKRLRTSPAAESKTFAPSTTIPATGYIIRDGADEDDALKPATADLSAQEAASSSSNIFWPKDLLAEDFKTIRILTFSYESDPRRPEQHNLYTLSNILLSRLADKRADFVSRALAAST